MKYMNNIPLSGLKGNKRRRQSCRTVSWKCAAVFYSPPIPSSPVSWRHPEKHATWEKCRRNRATQRQCLLTKLANRASLLCSMHAGCSYTAGIAMTTGVWVIICAMTPILQGETIGGWEEKGMKTELANAEEESKEEKQQRPRQKMLFFYWQRKISFLNRTHAVNRRLERTRFSKHWESQTN